MMDAVTTAKRVLEGDLSKGATYIEEKLARAVLDMQPKWAKAEAEVSRLRAVQAACGENTTMAMAVRLREIQDELSELRAMGEDTARTVIAMRNVFSTVASMLSAANAREAKR